MNSRREFFNQFIGHLGILRDDIRGVENIPLNRLKELPENIIEQIKPVFFPGENFYIKDRIFYIPNNKPEVSFEFNELEFKALGYFNKDITLKQTATEIKANSEMSFDEIYQTVTFLFFKLASFRICHPKEVFQFDEIIKANQRYS